MTRTLLLVLGAILALPLLGAGAALPETNAVLAGAAYLKSIQEPDGTYGSSDPGQNMDSIFAVRAAGYDPAKDLVAGVGPLQYLTANAAGVPNAPSAAKAALAAEALGLDPKAVGGTDLIAKIGAGFDSATGKYAPGDDFSQAIAMIGLACTGNSVPAGAVEALQDAQLDPGGWGFGGTADPDTTAIAVQALVAAGVAADHPSVIGGHEYLLAAQGTDGGWGYDVAASNASSTAFVVQALLALGEDPESAAYTKSGVTPVEYLLSQQLANGSFAGFDPTYATNQVLPALAGRTFCDAPETPITQVRPVATATPTASPTVPAATATPTQPVPSVTQAPLPPNAGSGPAAEQGSRTAWIATAALVALAGGFGFAAKARRRAMEG